MNYQTTFTVSPQPDWTQDTWEFDMALLPHPIAFGWIDSRPTGAPTSGHTFTVLNSQLPGDTHADKFNSFISLAERWRLTYCAVSVYQDGADLNNQGTIVVAQVPCEPIERHYMGFDTTTGSLVGNPRVQFWVNDQPNFDASQGMPNAYFGRSREGAYVPLKLTQTCQEWSSVRDTVYYSTAIPDEESQVMVLPMVGQDAVYPFGDGNDGGSGTGLNGLNIAIAYHPAGTTAYTVFGQPTVDMLNGTFGHISARNLAKSTSYAFFFRVGIEMQVKPNSTLAPQMKLSPSYDPKALDAYFAIARELKDGYPVDYNCRGKLWGVIQKAASVALPMLKMAGPYGQAAATLGMGALALGDRLMGAGERDRPSAAATERAVAAKREAMVRVARRPPRKKKPVKKVRAGPASSVHVKQD